LPQNTPTFDLYLVTDRHQTGGRELLWVIEQALEGGVKCIQLREKDLNGRELYHLAEKVKILCADRHATLLINDRIDVALAVDAEGVHLGGTSMPVQATRELVGAKRLIGVSVHSLKEAQDADQAGADFIVFGPIYFTPSKAPYGEPQGLARLKKVVEKVSVPVYSIGGIKVENIADTKKTGIRGVALISSIIACENPRVATLEILRAIEK